MTATSYLVGLGSNRWHGRHGPPARVVAAGVDALRQAGLAVVAVSGLVRTPALGPGGRDYANAVVLVDTLLAPPALLMLLKRIEGVFGRRPGRRWGARVIDCDLLAWSGGAWPPRPRARVGPLLVPHPGLTTRRFALAPAAAIASGWRDPRDGRTLRQHEARHRRPRQVDRRRPRA